MLSFCATSFSKTINVKHGSLHNGDDDSTFFLSRSVWVSEKWLWKKKEIFPGTFPYSPSYQLSGLFSVLFCLNLIGVWGFSFLCNIFSVNIYFFSRCCIKKHFIFLKNRFLFCKRGKVENIDLERVLCRFYWFSSLNSPKLVSATRKKGILILKFILTMIE